MKAVSGSSIVSVNARPSGGEVTAACPLSHAPPYLQPWVRRSPPDAVQRVRDWCERLIPGVEVHIVEWVGADPRQPIHATVLSFRPRRWPRVVFFRKIEDLDRDRLRQAFRVHGPVG